VQNGPN